MTADGFIGGYTGKYVHDKMGGSRVLTDKMPEFYRHADIGRIAYRSWLCVVHNNCCFNW